MALVLLDLGALGCGRAGTQEVCAAWLAQGEWRKGEALIYSSQGRQSHASASLVLNYLLAHAAGRGDGDEGQGGGGEWLPPASLDRTCSHPPWRRQTHELEAVW